MDIHSRYTWVRARVDFRIGEGLACERSDSSVRRRVYHHLGLHREGSITALRYNPTDPIAFDDDINQGALKKGRYPFLFYEDLEDMPESVGIDVGLAFERS